MTKHESAQGRPPSDVAPYTRREARELSRLGLTAFDEALRRGDFPSFRVGRRVFCPRAEFEAALRGERDAPEE